MMNPPRTAGARHNAVIKTRGFTASRSSIPSIADRETPDRLVSTMTKSAGITAILRT